MATMYESEVSDHCYSGPSYSLPRSHASSWRPSDPWFDSDCLEAKCVTRRLERVYLAAYRSSDTQTNAVAGTSIDVQATKAALYVQQQKYRDLCPSSILRSGATQFNLIVSHQEDAAIEYTGLHRLFIKKPWLDVMNVQSYHPILNLSVSI